MLSSIRWSTTCARSCVTLGLLCATVRCDLGTTGYLTNSTSSSGQGGTSATASTAGGTSAGVAAGDTAGGTPTPDSPNAVTASGMGIGLTFDTSTGSNPNGGQSRTHAVSDTYWSTTIQELAKLGTGTVPAATVVVGVDSGGNCILTLSNKVYEGTQPYISANPNQNFETLLTALDAASGRVVIEVQPGYAPVAQLATIVMSSYQTHPSVVGFGVDVQYYQSYGYSSQAAISDDDAAAVVAAVQAVNSSYQVYLKASNAKNLPGSSTSGVVFVSSQGGFGSQAAMVSAVQSWATTFAPSPVQFNVGQLSDEGWWCGSSATATASGPIAGAIGAGGTNLVGVLWQAQTIVDVYPTPSCSPASGGASATSTGAATTGGTTTSGGTGTTGGTTTTGGTGTTGGTTTSGGTGTTGGTATSGGTGTTGGTATSGGTATTGGTATSGGTSASGGSSTSTSTTGGGPG